MHVLTSIGQKTGERGATPASNSQYDKHMYCVDVSTGSPPGTSNLKTLFKTNTTRGTQTTQEVTHKNIDATSIVTLDAGGGSDVPSKTYDGSSPYDQCVRLCTGPFDDDELDIKDSPTCR